MKNITLQWLRFLIIWILIIYVSYSGYNYISNKENIIKPEINNKITDFEKTNLKNKFGMINNSFVNNITVTKNGTTISRKR